MMPTEKIIEVLIAFKQGRRVVLAKDITFPNGMVRRKNNHYSDLWDCLEAIKQGAELEIEREPITIWFPTFHHGRPAFSLPMDSKFGCDEAYKNAGGYTGAVEFREVMK